MESLFTPKKGSRIMKPENIEKINHSFEIQAPNFESKSVNFTKEEYLNYTISCVAPCKENTLLEVAAGTCACAAPLRHWYRQSYVWTQRFPCCRLDIRKPIKNI